MKTRPTPAFVLLAVLSAALVSLLSAAPASSAPAKASPLGAVERYGVKAVQPGDSATKVAAYLGSPDRKLSGDTWIYRRFQCQDTLMDAADCTTLIISFSHGRVSDLQRVNEPAVQLIAAKLAAPKPASGLLAGK